MTAAVAWMNARDVIYEVVDPILAGPALQAELRKRGARRYQRLRHGLMRPRQLRRGNPLVVRWLNAGDYTLQ